MNITRFLASFLITKYAHFIKEEEKKERKERDNEKRIIIIGKSNTSIFMRKYPNFLQKIQTQIEIFS